MESLVLTHANTNPTSFLVFTRYVFHFAEISCSCSAYPMGSVNGVLPGVAGRPSAASSPSLTPSRSGSDFDFSSSRDVLETLSLTAPNRPQCS